MEPLSTNLCHYFQNFLEIFKKFFLPSNVSSSFRSTESFFHVPNLLFTVRSWKIEAKIFQLFSQRMHCACALFSLAHILSFFLSNFSNFLLSMQTFLSPYFAFPQWFTHYQFAPFFACTHINFTFSNIIIIVIVL